MRFEPLGDQAVMVYCDDEKQATSLASLIRRLNPCWLVDVVQAYITIAVYHESTLVDYFLVVDWLRTAFSSNSCKNESTIARSHVIPCCYEFGLDFQRIQQHFGLGRDEIISLHSRMTYTVYAIGFCPGFPYLGYLPPKLTGVPRLASPRLQVDAGSVGLTGRQTGIYTETRPGGWNIVGKTPLLLVDVSDGYFPLRTGDDVQFCRIDEREYREMRGNRLSGKAIEATGER